MQPIDVYGALVKQQHALNETIAPLEKTSQASAAHSAGTQLIYNGVLYDVTTNIAVGDTLTVGTNISVADDITTQISSVNTALTNLSITGTTNNTGSTITAGTYFYLNGTLVRAKASIANNATFTLNTNYEVVTAGALNELKDTLATKVTMQSYTLGLGKKRAITWTGDPQFIIEINLSGTSGTLFFSALLKGYGLGTSSRIRGIYFYKGTDELSISYDNTEKTFYIVNNSNNANIVFTITDKLGTFFDGNFTVGSEVATTGSETDGSSMQTVAFTT